MTALCSQVPLFSSGTCLLYETWKCDPGSIHPGHYCLLILPLNKSHCSPDPGPQLFTGMGSTLAVQATLQLFSYIWTTAHSQTPHASGHTCHYKRNTRLRQSAPGGNMPIKTRLWPFVCSGAVFSVLDTQLCSACWSTVTPVTSTNSSLPLVISVPCLQIFTSGLFEQPQDTNRPQKKAVCAVRSMHTLNRPFYVTL